MAVLKISKRSGQGLIETCVIAALALGAWFLCWRLAAQEFYLTVTQGHAVMSARVALGGGPPTPFLSTITQSTTQSAQATSKRGPISSQYRISLPLKSKNKGALLSFF